MIINIQNKKDLITLDLRLKEIRYITNIDIKTANRSLYRIDLSNDDVSGYKFLYLNNKSLFLKTLFGELKSFESFNIDIHLSNLNILGESWEGFISKK